MRIPVESVKFNYFPGNIDIKLIWIPVFRESIYPEKNSVWVKGKYSFLESKLLINRMDIH